MGKDKNTGGSGLVAGDTSYVTIDKYSSEGCDRAIEAKDSAKLKIGEAKIKGKRGFEEATKKPATSISKTFIVTVVSGIIVAAITVFYLQPWQENIQEQRQPETQQIPQ